MPAILFRSNLFFATIALGFVWSASVRGDEKAVKLDASLNIPYVAEGHERQKLDVFRPAGAKDKPVLLVLHGGGWMIGDKNFFGIYGDVARGFAKQGFVVVAANYRLSPAVRHPEHIKDVARAYAWTRKNIKDYGGNPDKIFVCGHSAGGHLAALLATDPSHLADPALGMKDNDGKAIKGVIGVSGVYSIPKDDEFGRLASSMLSGLGKKEKDANMNPLAPDLVGVASSLFNPFPLVFGKDAKVFKEASPIHHVKPGLVPFLLIYAEHDLPFLDTMAKEFDAALRKEKNDVELIRMAKRNHNSVYFWATDPSDDTNKAIVKFLDKHR